MASYLGVCGGMFIGSFVGCLFAIYASRLIDNHFEKLRDDKGY